MARRNEGLFDILVMCPWWVSIIFSAVSYIALKFIVPAIKVDLKGPINFGAIMFKGFAGAAPIIAPYIAFAFLVPALISAIRAWRKRRLLDHQQSIESIRQISWKEFEELVGEAYRRQGYIVTENEGTGPDGGVDLILEKKGEVILVQCKQWRTTKVGVEKVRELYGVQMSNGAHRSILITSGFFTQEAQNFAANNPMDLVDGPQLQELIKNVQAGGKAVPSVLPIPITSQATMMCPTCGSEMVLRTARKGANAGQKFWGCSKFPQCRGIVQYSGK
ncbi:MAG: hypothetical protein A2283_15805 [Lentisphaerae bacterium RIFOXYA12_FULL_48_11]|nr:MAG: hypothetical protein A2283_15805 [Lentisphaerae bacterium RIFOXYA12_FULL_48_11]